ncbi:MAG: ATP-binding protein [Fretibacterium sp.]|nr:ATP-binding protein [Fretibacterium sp.]
MLKGHRDGWTHLNFMTAEKTTGSLRRDDFYHWDRWQKRQLVPAGCSFFHRCFRSFFASSAGIEELQGVTVLATTNRMERLDPSLLAAGRFDLVLELPLPGREAREQIFRIELRGKPTAPDVRPDELAERTEGASGADIALICRRAAMEALKASLARGQETLLIEGAHFEAALKDFQGRRGLSPS